MRMKRVILVILCASVLVLLGFLARIDAVAGYTAAMVAAEKVMTEVADQVNDMRLEAITHKKAEEIRANVLRASEGYRGAVEELRAEIKRLEVNKAGNAPLLAELNKTLSDTEEAKKRMKGIISMMDTDSNMINAVKSGHLVKTLRSVAEVIGKTRQTVDRAHDVMGSTGSEKPGFIEVRSIESQEGKMHFYMSDYVAGQGFTEVELKQGRKVPVRALPIVIRACVEDDFKTDMTKKRDEHLMPGGTYFENPGDSSPGHKFKYTNEKVGTSTWIAREEYTWSIDRFTEKSKIRGMRQRSSDPSTKDAKGDIVEIHTAGAVAQNLAFEIEGTVVSWDRRSVLHGREKTGSIVPRNNTARARITVSLFSN